MLKFLPHVSRLIWQEIFHCMKYMHKNVLLVWFVGVLTALSAQIGYIVP